MAAAAAQIPAGPSTTAGLRSCGEAAALFAAGSSATSKPLSIPNPKLSNLLLAPFFVEAIETNQDAWRSVISSAVLSGIPVPVFVTALAFYDGYRTASLPAGLIQAQRDYFGAHTYERTDRPRGEFFHTNWTGRGGTTSSSTYNA